MKSRLSKEEFKLRLTKLTSKDKDFSIFSSYNFSGTPFCGTYDDSKFELTRNSFWRHVKDLIIKGEYRELNGDSTEVTYTIGLTKFKRNLAIAFACFLFLIPNTIIILNQDHFGQTLLPTLLKINAFLGFGCLSGIALTRMTKKIVNQRFKDEFEIDLEDEWEKLAASSSNQNPI